MLIAVRIQTNILFAKKTLRGLGMCNFSRFDAANVLIIDEYLECAVCFWFVCLMGISIILHVYDIILILHRFYFFKSENSGGDHTIYYK